MIRYKDWVQKNRLDSVRKNREDNEEDSPKGKGGFVCAGWNYFQ